MLIKWNVLIFSSEEFYMKDATNSKWHSYRAKCLTTARLTVWWWFHIANQQTKWFKESLVFMKDLIHSALSCEIWLLPACPVLLIEDIRIFHGSEWWLKKKIHSIFARMPWGDLQRTTYKWLSCVQGENFFSVGYRKYNSEKLYKGHKTKVFPILSSFTSLKI